jgi:hypothetical protein
MALKKKKPSRQQRVAKSMKGLPKSSWRTTWEDTKVKRVGRSTQSLLCKDITLDGLISDSHMYKLNPKIAKYRSLRKEGKVEW